MHWFGTRNSRSVYKKCRCIAEISPWDPKLRSVSDARPRVEVTEGFTGLLEPQLRSACALRHKRRRGARTSLHLSDFRRSTSPATSHSASTFWSV
jgi:hypothetical protein